jgi:hypothetical protein
MQGISWLAEWLLASQEGLCPHGISYDHDHDHDQMSFSLQRLKGTAHLPCGISWKLPAFIQFLFHCTKSKAARHETRKVIGCLDQSVNLNWRDEWLRSFRPTVNSRQGISHEQCRSTFQAMRYEFQGISCPPEEGNAREWPGRFHIAVLCFLAASRPESFRFQPYNCSSGYEIRSKTNQNITKLVWDTLL